jgi:predicted DNA-binding antitoxin AbrB/MazE fold protein
MVQQVDAVYENGLLRPLEPLDLLDSQRVRITVTTPELCRSKRDMKLLERVRAEIAGTTEIPSLEEVQRMLSAIPDSLTRDFVAEREDR